MTSLDFGLVTQIRRAGLDARPMRIGRSASNILLASNPEASISFGRLVTGLFAVLAVYLDPMQPAPFLVKAQVTLGLYMVFSLLLVIFPVRKSLDSPVHLGVHFIDVAREREVAVQICGGLSNRAIAQKLGTTEGTIGIHLNNIYRKLDITNRTTLAALHLQYTAGPNG